jgi:hypothetical protein
MNFELVEEFDHMLIYWWRGGGFLSTPPTLFSLQKMSQDGFFYFTCLWVD